jgi:uncharacterized protein
MNAVPLHYVWRYDDRDRAFWRMHLEDWLPEKIFDAHLHIQEPEYRLRTMIPEKKRQYWVNELVESLGAEEAGRCFQTVFPQRDFGCLCFGFPDLDFDLEASNRRLQTECVRRGWHRLAVIRPDWSAERLAAELALPNVIGVKVYYALIGEDLLTRDKYLEASIFDFLPPHQLEVLDRCRAWVTLHVPKADRLGHPQNIAEIRQIRREYPNLVLVIAHLGRCYTPALAEEAFPLLAGDEGLFFDNSAVFHPEVHRLALKHFGPQRILYGTDNPVFFMRGRQRWGERTYVNHTDYPFAFNRQREPLEMEAQYTLYMYEALYALRQACERVKLERRDVEDLLCNNALRLVAGANNTAPKSSA